MSTCSLVVRLQVGPGVPLSDSCSSIALQHRARSLPECWRGSFGYVGRRRYCGRGDLWSQAVDVPKCLRHAVFRKPPVERGAVHLEGPGGLGDVAVAGLEDAEDVFAFDLGEG